MVEPSKLSTCGLQPLMVVFSLNDYNIQMLIKLNQDNNKLRKI